MHEFGLMESIVERVEEEARSRDAAHVDRIRIAVGGLVHASRESLVTAFELLSKGTILEGATMVLDDVPGAFRCGCGFRGGESELDPSGLPAGPPWLCPTCGGLLEVVGGEGIVLSELVLRTGDPD